MPCRSLRRFPRHDTELSFRQSEGKDWSFRTHVRNLDSFYLVKINVKVKVLSEMPRRSLPRFPRNDTKLSF